MLTYRSLHAGGDWLAAVPYEAPRTLELFAWRDGTHLARVELPLETSPHAGALVRGADLFVLAGWREGLVALAMPGGAPRWAWPDLRHGVVRWLPRAERIAFVRTQGRSTGLHLVDPTTGRWRVRVPNVTCAADLDGPGSSLLVAGDAGPPLRVERDTGRVLRRFERATADPALACLGAHGLALFAGERLDAFDLDTGARRWWFDPGPGERIVAMCEVDGGVASIATGRAAPARLIVLDPSGAVRSDREIRGSELVFLDGGHVASNDGTVRRIADHAVLATLVAPA
ncbi:MAG: hypothetical protein KF729_32570 [Sandaracinaceae bacterium]|nr:hypothetical protein [Sandaracinaceae bacterium]